MDPLLTGTDLSRRRYWTWLPSRGTWREPDLSQAGAINFSMSLTDCNDLVNVHSGLHNDRFWWPQPPSSVHPHGGPANALTLSGV